ncbi:MAG: hypothetical protein GX592_04905 [Clostridiales bacterium]|nr:hypothetical protein [Clostridiales bacterium]
MKRSIAVLLCILSILGFSIEALAGEDEQQAFLDLLDSVTLAETDYRVRLPERAPDAHEAAEVRIENHDTTIDIDAAIHDFGKKTAAVYRATPPDIDAERLISFFWPEGDPAAILASKEILSDGAEEFAHAGALLRLSRNTGEISFLADAERAGEVDFRRHKHLITEPGEIFDIPSIFADPDAVRGYARDFLSLFGIEEEPMLLVGYGLREECADRMYRAETFDFAIVRDGLPFCNRSYFETPDGGRAIPAQNLVVSFDERGLADLTATVFRLEPLGGAEGILPYRAMFDDLKEGEGFLWWGGPIPIASITLEYMLVPADGEASQYICRPVWRFHESARPWGIAWADDRNVYAHDALTGAFATS